MRAGEKPQETTGAGELALVQATTGDLIKDVLPDAMKEVLSAIRQEAQDRTEKLVKDDQKETEKRDLMANLLESPDLAATDGRHLRVANGDLSEAAASVSHFLKGERESHSAKAEKESHLVKAEKESRLAKAETAVSTDQTGRIRAATTEAGHAGMREVLKNAHTSLTGKTPAAISREAALTDAPQEDVNMRMVKTANGLQKSISTSQPH